MSLRSIPALLAIALVLVPATGAVGGRDPFGQDRAALEEPWFGTWDSGAFIYKAEMHLSVTEDNQVEGRIEWTLERSPNPDDAPKIGLQGTEFVAGAYQPGPRLLSLEGYNKDDPNGILGLDTYRLLLSENREVLGGITANHGKWTATFLATH